MAWVSRGSIIPGVWDMLIRFSNCRMLKSYFAAFSLAFSKTISGYGLSDAVPPDHQHPATAYPAYYNTYKY